MPGLKRRVTRLVLVCCVVAVCYAQAPADAAGGVGSIKVRRDVPVTATDLVTNQANNSPSVAVDPTDRRFVVIANRRDGPTFGCGLQVSSDAGRSWIPVSVPNLPKGADTCYAPDIAFDRNGRLYYLFIGLKGAGNSPMGAFLASSDDNAASFTKPRRVLGPLRYQVRMALNPRAGKNGRIHLVWLKAGTDPPLGGLPNGANPILSAYSEDEGESFSKPVQVNDPARPLSVAPALALGPGRRVHILYYDLKDDFRDYQGLEGPAWDGKWSLVSTSSRNGGRTFSPGVVVDDGIVPPERVMLIFTMPPPALAVGPAEMIYTSWHDARNGNWDVFFRTSSNGGESWKALRRLNDDPTDSISHQYLPRLSVAPNGRLDSIFYDRRRDPGNRGTDVFYSYSMDEGNTFSPNQPLTSVFFDSKKGPRYGVPSAAGLVEQGGKLGLVSQNSRALAAWADARNSGLNQFSHDIFATTVDLTALRRNK